MTQPFVSVIIPVLNDAGRLKACLEALSAQTYPAPYYEVIVVDNGSSEDIEPLVRQFHGAVFARQEQPGLHVTRNKGISMAKGQILAFTDADCLPYDNWMEEGVRCITGADDCGLVAGKIEITFAGNNNPTAVELFEKLTAFDQEKFIKRWHFGATANVFTKREVIGKVGMLDGSLKSGADLEWGRRVYEAGYGQVYCDKAVVRHPARRTIRQIIDKHRRVAGGLSDIRSKETDYTLKRFLVDLKDDWPGGADFGNIFSRDTLKAAQKIRIAAIMALVKSARIFEMIRLKIGGSSRRI